jgi:hypothetical protein
VRFCDQGTVACTAFMQRPHERVALGGQATYDRAGVEERVRSASQKVRWRLIIGLISALLAVGVTLPAAAAHVNLGARIAEIWPNGASSGDFSLTNLPVTEIIWPNAFFNDTSAP